MAINQTSRSRVRIGRKSAGTFIGKTLMEIFPCVRMALAICVGAVGLSGVATAQGNYVPEGSEYPITGILHGEQVQPQVSIKPSGGYLIWRDNITDGSGYGISARKIDGSLNSTLSSFQVNQQGQGDQERPAVSLLNDGGAVFVWQGGLQGFQHIYARFFSATTGFLTGDILVGSTTNRNQTEAVVTTLTNGNAVVAYASINQANSGSLQDIYFQILTPAGVKVGSEERANQSYIAFNQRSVAIAPLKDGRFVVVWISEQQQFENSADVRARVFTAEGIAVGGELLINSGTNICANPSVAPAADGGFAVTWMQRDLQNSVNKWDVFVRPVSAAGFNGTERRVNTWTAGDQLVPKIAAMDTDYLVTWTSMAQDGSKDGVYGQFLRGDGALLENEFRVNTTTVENQQYPVIASDGAARFLVVWKGYVGGNAVCDFFAQRYVNLSQPLAAPGAPIVSILSSSSLSVSWPAVSGLSVANYEVFADGAATATVAVTNTYWTVTGLAPASVHSYRLAYVLLDGRRSPLSVATPATTYGAGAYYGIPFEWMSQFNWGTGWPTVQFDSDGDGMSNWDEFLAGTNPTDANSVLRVRLQPTGQGLFLNWNTQAGLIYQVWSATAPGGPWTKVGQPRFAADTVDSMYVGGSNARFYRIERLR